MRESIIRNSISASVKGQNTKVEALNDAELENKVDYLLPDGATYTGQMKKSYSDESKTTVWVKHGNGK